MTQTTFLGFLFGRVTHIQRSIGGLSERRIVSKPLTASRLRFVNIVKPVDETPQEYAYRIEYKKIQEWNNDYWARNNEMFNNEKSDYISKNFDNDESPEQALNHDQLAPFYQNFLEKNKARQKEYNKIWYRNHGLLLISAVKAKISRIQNNLFHRTDGDRPDRT